MFKRSLAALALLALAFSFVFIPVPKTTAQNIGYGGRYPSDAGKAVFNYGTATDTTAQDMAPAGGTGVFNYIYEAQCMSTSATVAVAIIKVSTTALTAVPCPPSSGFGAPIRFNPPLKATIANTKLTMEASTSITTAYFYMAARQAR